MIQALGHIKPGILKPYGFGVMGNDILPIYNLLALLISWEPRAQYWQI